MFLLLKAAVRVYSQMKLAVEGTLPCLHGCFTEKLFSLFLF